MSDHYLRLVPVDPKWQAMPEAAEAAVRVLAEMLPAAEEVSSRLEESVVFYDAGQNTISVSCPACGADSESWWGEAMGEAFASAYRDLVVTTPCCARPMSLNDLAYDWPAAFGSFSLEVANPGVPVFADEQRAAVERALGTSLKVVWQHL